jgi:hypothetical protein
MSIDRVYPIKAKNQFTGIGLETVRINPPRAQRGVSFDGFDVLASNLADPMVIHHDHRATGLSIDPLRGRSERPL